MNNCINCNSEILSISAKKFCSRSCSVSYNNKQNPKRKLEGKCKTCNKQISSSRIYCSLCIKQARSQKSINGQEFKTCKICKENKHYTLFYGNKDKSFPYCKSCESSRVKIQQRDFKQKCISYKGGKCQNCGYNKCNAALEFHHLEPEHKDFSISHFNKRSWDLNKELVMIELDKCILLCANCHREIHTSMNTGYQNRTDEI